MTYRLAVAVALLCGCLPPLAASAMPADEAARLLNRLGYGPAPGDIDRLATINRDDYFDQQLHPVPEPDRLRDRLAALSTTHRNASSLFAEYGPVLRKLAKADENAKREYREDIRRVVEEAESARLLRALYSPNQLQERLVDFWFNHFNVFDGKGIQGRLWVGPYEREAIRPYVFGHFRDLLAATAKHPAMLFYLDNWRSAAEGFRPRGGPEKGKAIGLNENYAREVMELHTLGVDGGYTQHDVTELARILTGWTFNPRAMASGDSAAGFVFAERRHDHGSKLFLGQRFGDDGMAEGERALDLLARHPATAHHIAFELAQFFVADAPPSALVDRVAAAFTRTDGDLRATVRSLITSSEFLDARASQFKTPYEFIVSSLRASDVETASLRPALGALRQMGQPLYGCATPDGWKNTQETWLNPGAMIQRINFATALGSGRLPALASALARVDFKSGADAGTMIQSAIDEDDRAGDTRKPQPLDVAVLQRTLGLALSANTRETIAQAPAPLKAALVLGSPEFMRR